MKNKKKLPNREKLAVLKKKENAMTIAGFSLALACIASIPLVFVGANQFNKKLDPILERTGYNDYAEEKIAEYEQQYNNNEIPRGVYESYIEYYNKFSTMDEYFKSIGDEDAAKEFDGIVKSRQAYIIAVGAVGILSAFSGLWCIMDSKMLEADISNLIETMEAEGESIEYDPNNANNANFEDIFPDFSKKDDEDENEESK